jgi:hypothetical protein
VELEFRNTEKGYQQQSEFPFGVNNEIVVTSEQEDVRTLLPIKIRIIAGDKVYTNNIPNAPKDFCTGKTSCSIPGPVIQDPGEALVKITTSDKGGNQIAVYTQSGRSKATGEKSSADESNKGSEQGIFGSVLNSLTPWLIGLLFLSVIGLTTAFFWKELESLWGRSIGRWRTAKASSKKHLKK